MGSMNYNFAPRRIAKGLAWHLVPVIFLVRLFVDHAGQRSSWDKDLANLRQE